MAEVSELMAKLEKLEGKIDELRKDFHKSDKELSNLKAKFWSVISLAGVIGGALSGFLTRVFF